MRSVLLSQLVLSTDHLNKKQDNIFKLLRDLLMEEQKTVELDLHLRIELHMQRLELMLLLKLSQLGQVDT